MLDYSDVRTHKSIWIVKHPIIYLIGILILLITLNNSLNNSLSQIGFAFMLLLLTGSTAYLFLIIIRKFRFQKKLFALFLYLLLLCSTYILRLTSGIAGSRGIITSIQFILVSGFLLMMTLIRWTDAKILTLSKFFSIFSVFTFLWWVASRLPAEFSAYLGNANALGMILFCLLFFILCGYYFTKGKRKVFYGVIAVLVVIEGLIGARYRMLALAGVASIITYFLWPYLSRMRFLYTSFLLILTLGISSFTLIYSNLQINPDFLKLNSIILQLSGKEFFSGRQKIWPYVIEAIQKRPLFGYGSGALPSDVFPPGYAYSANSAHSLYLQICLQLGIVGLFLFISALFLIWMLLWRGRQDWVVRLAGAFFIGIIVDQAFEVAMTQNSLSIGIIQWLVIAIGASRSLYIHSLGDNRNQLHQSSQSQRNIRSGLKISPQ